MMGLADIARATGGRLASSQRRLDFFPRAGSMAPQ